MTDKKARSKGNSLSHALKALDLSTNLDAYELESLMLLSKIASNKANPEISKRSELYRRSVWSKQLG
jgi:hypothetical protein